MISLAVNRTLKLVSDDDPFLSSISEAVDDDQVELGSLDFMFAIKNIDPKLGRITAKQTLWGTKQDFLAIDIEMVDCNELLPGGSHEDKQNNKNFDLEILNNFGSDLGYLCPINIEDLTVSGYFGSDIFNYVIIEVLGCE